MRLPIPPVILGLLPWLIGGALGVMNGLLYWKELHKSEVPMVWHGRLMPGQPLRLKARPEPKVVEAPSKPYANEPLRDLVVKDEEKEATGSGAPKTEVGAKGVPVVKGFVVEAGTFVFKLGAETLMQRLQKQGMKPNVEAKDDLIPLNYVQAGPYATLVAAKEAEIKLKAGGFTDSKIEDNWEGYLITLGKYFLMGYAVQTMEQVEKLGVRPLRMVKIQTALPIQRVWLGPYTTRETAKEISARIAHLGLSVPVIQEYPKEDRTTYTVAPSKSGSGAGK